MSASAGRPDPASGPGPGVRSTVPPFGAPPVALVLSYVGFVSLGLPDTILGAAWPAIRADLRLPLDAGGAALSLTTAGIVLSSAASGRIRARFGTAAVLIGSTLLAALALGIAAGAPRWPIFLVGSFVAGVGGGAVDASLNHFVARRHSARQMNWLHASWGVGASFSPVLVSLLLARGSSWRTPYGILAAIELALAGAFVASRAIWRDADGELAASEQREITSPPRGAMGASVLMFLFYGGVEAGMGLWATSLLTMTRGASAATAGALVAVYWGALTVGRFALGAVADRVGPMRLLRLTLRVGVVALGALAVPGTPLPFAGAALAVLGLALAPVYPLAMHDTPARFGAAGARLVGYQVAACSVGISLIPWLAGVLGARASVLAIPVLLLGLAIVTAMLELLRRGR